MSFDDRIRATLDDCEGPFNFAVLADQLVKDTPTRELTDWLRANARVFVASAMQDISRSERSRARAHAKATQFSEAAEAFAGGDEDAFSPFRVSYAINDENDRLRVEDMTGEHHLFVAGTYAQRAEQSAMLAAFHRAVAKKVGKHRTADVMDEQTYEELRASICRTPAVSAA